MSSPDRRNLLFAGAAALAAGGCGFRPLYRQDADAGVYGTVALQEARDPETFAYRERLRRRLGDGGSAAPLALAYEIEMTEEGVAITPASDVTRYQVAARARWRLIRISDGAELGAGDVTARGAYDATSAPYATRAAQRAERVELATELAELTAARILAARQS